VVSDECWMRRGGGAETREKRALQFAVLSRLEKCNALFSGELRAFLIAAQPIRKWRVESGAGAVDATFSGDAVVGIEWERPGWRAVGLRRIAQRLAQPGVAVPRKAERLG
jgi:hypothetical protein